MTSYGRSLSSQYHGFSTEDNPTLHNDIPAELPGVDLETDSSDTQVVSPAVIQSDAERVQTAIQITVFS